MICRSIDTILAALLLLTIPSRNVESSPKLETLETKKDEDVQEANVTIEAGEKENNEKDAFLNDSNSPNETSSTKDDTIGTSILGY